VPTITDFDPLEDRIEISTAYLGDPFFVDINVLTVVDWADGAGADVLLNGEVAADVAGAQGLDPAVIKFVQSDYV